VASTAPRWEEEFAFFLDDLINDVLEAHPAPPAPAAPRPTLCARGLDASPSACEGARGAGGQITVLQNDVAMGRHVTDDAIGLHAFPLKNLQAPRAPRPAPRRAPRRRPCPRR